jgi:ABC-type Zn uptake system ZnuABC Zn-binding protein ZnuA
MKKLTLLLMISILILSLIACESEGKEDDTLSVVATTTMLADLAKVIGGDIVEVEA